MTYHKMMQEYWYNQRLPDGGPIYTETNLDRLFPEPWNAISSLCIIIPALIWLFRIRKERIKYGFLLYCIPFIILGGAGSTLFHGLRQYSFFLLLDILPTAILTLSLSIFFWLKILKKWWIIFFIVIPTFLVRILFFRNIPQHTAINISYAITGIITAIPIVLIIIKTSYFKLREVILTIFFFCLALFFRETDALTVKFLPMGTHFLWHALSGIGTYFILSYLYHFRNWEICRQQFTSDFMKS